MILLLAGEGLVQMDVSFPFSFNMSQSFENAFFMEEPIFRAFWYSGGMNPYALVKVGLEVDHYEDRFSPHFWKTGALLKSPYFRAVFFYRDFPESFESASHENYMDSRNVPLEFYDGFGLLDARNIVKNSRNWDPYGVMGFAFRTAGKPSLDFKWVSLSPVLRFTASKGYFSFRTWNLTDDELNEKKYEAASLEMLGGLAGFSIEIDSPVGLFSGKFALWGGLFNTTQAHVIRGLQVSLGYDGNELLLQTGSREDGGKFMGVIGRFEIFGIEFSPFYLEGILHEMYRPVFVYPAPYPKYLPYLPEPFLPGISISAHIEGVSFISTISKDILAMGASYKVALLNEKSDLVLGMKYFSMEDTTAYSGYIETSFEGFFARLDVSGYSGSVVSASAGYRFSSGWLSLSYGDSGDVFSDPYAPSLDPCDVSLSQISKIGVVAHFEF